MGKKGKKKGSGGKKKKGGKKKGGEPQMTWKEALLAYKINVMERQMEDVKYEQRALQEKNSRHKERNERLKHEQTLYMKNLLKQAKEFDKKLESEDVVEKEAVIEVMMEGWDASRQEDRNITDIKTHITQKETEILLERRQVAYWEDYRDKGLSEHQKQVMLLEQELGDMQASFDEMAAHLERTQNAEKGEIEIATQETLDNQKYLASERAMAKMDKYSRQEVVDNDWLKHETEIHQNEVDVLVEEVEKLEQDNLEIMSELFECTIDDLKISRNFFLTQFADAENLEESGILEMDLAKLSISQEERKHSGRPKSAVQRAVEDKLRSVDAAIVRVRQEEEDEDLSQFDGHVGTEEDSEADLDNHLPFDEEDFDDYLKLGPLELKLLSVAGQQMEIHKLKTPAPEEQEAKKWKPDMWPITHPMLKQTVTIHSPRTTLRRK